MWLDVSVGAILTQCLGLPSLVQVQELPGDSCTRPLVVPLCFSADLELLQMVDGAGWLGWVVLVDSSLSPGLSKGRRLTWKSLSPQHSGKGSGFGIL